jgi:hypothetical protein
VNGKRSCSATVHPSQFTVYRIFSWLLRDEGSETMQKIIIKAGDLEAMAELNDSATARAIWQALPLESSANTWGEEIYFRIPVSQDLEPDAKELVQLGDLGYWPQGEAFCVFFGATPISGPGEIRPASAVNIVGRLLHDPKGFLSVASGTLVKIERATSPDI